MERRNVSLDGLIKTRLNEVANDFFAREARSYFDREETQKSCLDRTAHVTEKIWENSGRYKPITIYLAEKDHFIELEGDIAVNMGEKMLTTRERFRGQPMPSWMRECAQKIGDEKDSYVFTKKLLQPLPSSLIKRMLIQIPNEQEFLDKCVEMYQLDKQQTSRNGAMLDDKTSGVMYCVIMDSFERNLAEYMATTFCKKDS